jgi:hypothetical protein
VNRTGNDGVELATPGQGYGFFQSGGGGKRSLDVRLARLATALSSNDHIFGRVTKPPGAERDVDDFRPDSGTIPEGDANSDSSAHARNGKRRFVSNRRAQAR